MNQELLAQIINNMRMNQPQGPVGNVSDTEMSMFSGNPMNGAVAGGNVGNVTDNEASLFNMVAGGVSNPMPRINEMRNNLATAGSVGNATNPQQRYDELQYLGSQGPLSNEEIDEFIMLRNQMNPNLPQERPVTMPFDIDGGSAGSKELTIEDLNRLFERANLMNRR